MKWVFGYGSLITHHGVNGRGMDFRYTPAHLYEANLKGYQRVWNAEWHGELFLGLVQSDCHYVNGVVFSLFEIDVPPFFDSEGINDNPPMYTFEDVTELVDVEESLNLSFDDRIFTCVTVNPTSKGKIPRHYISLINVGLRLRGEEFKKEFINTTFPNMPEGYYDI